MPTCIGRVSPCRLTVDAVPGRGTRVTIRVHALPEEPPAPQKVCPPNPAEPVVATSEGWTRVLVTDDHAYVRGVRVSRPRAEQTLKMVGEAVNGPEAVAPGGHHLGYRMPVM